MSEKLLPCPFCGGEARTFEYDGANQATCGGKHIDCAGTDVVAPVAMWNRRTPAPEGEAWRTVPVEPTEAMIEAAHALWGEGTGVNYVQLEPEDFYAAMLAASPVVPVGVSREGIARTLYEATPARVIHPLPIHSLSWDDIKTDDPARADRAYREADAVLAALGTKGADTGRRDIATAETTVLANTIRQHLLGIKPDDQAMVLEDDDWRLILKSLECQSAIDRPRQ